MTPEEKVLAAGVTLPWKGRGPYAGFTVDTAGTLVILRTPGGAVHPMPRDIARELGAALFAAGSGAARG